ncbi:ATP-grasp domain-containing protein [Ferruginivarius sediminum]|uniref:ATP-grasp domain-containing protein n=1 Tax=Ferruginivarius sediminum TaxID=2661937 RepID=A0A369T542_9PROT|nr:ATP-grasp domain-containing protein [Ferruginivarius sediminum]RDD60439.1 ATP-grasp domain-containing protein [Ferruginivarius sediminum]
MASNVFVMGLNDFNLAKLQRIHGAEDINFHGVIDPAAVYDTEEFDIPAMLREAEDRIAGFDGKVDAIIGYMDFPVSTMLPLLSRRFGTRNASLQSLLKCEHKYWSRVTQREVVPDCIPNFTCFDPFDDGALAKLGDAGLYFPFFVKPIKSSGSRLGFRIDSPEDFEHAVGKLRAEIGLISEPFNYVLEQAELPEEIRAVDGGFCMAEEIIGGHQCTVEGYVHEGEVVPYAVVDSVRYPQVLSFFYYLYPSKLPARIQRKMNELTRKVMSHIGYDNAAFNIEFFWDEVQDRIWLLEINTRIAQAHCDLFEKVDGVSHHQVTVDVALGRKPRMVSGEGEYALAADFFHRVFLGDGRVARVPTAEEIAGVEQAMPGTIVRPNVQKGMMLSDLPEQDSYSFAVAQIYMGAKNRSTLLRNYERVLKKLPFEFDEIIP